MTPGLGFPPEPPPRQAISPVSIGGIRLPPVIGDVDPALPGIPAILGRSPSPRSFRGNSDRPMASLAGDKRAGPSSPSLEGGCNMLTPVRAEPAGVVPPPNLPTPVNGPESRSPPLSRRGLKSPAPPMAAPGLAPPAAPPPGRADGMPGPGNFVPPFLTTNVGGSGGAAAGSALKSSFQSASTSS